MVDLSPGDRCLRFFFETKFFFSFQGRFSTHRPREPRFCDLLHGKNSNAVSCFDSLVFFFEPCTSHREGLQRQPTTFRYQDHLFYLQIIHWNQRRLLKQVSCKPKIFRWQDATGSSYLFAGNYLLKEPCGNTSIMAAIGFTSSLLSSIS